MARVPIKQVFCSLLSGFLVLALAIPSSTFGQPDTSEVVGPIPPPTIKDSLEKEAPFVATQKRLARRMLEVAGVSSRDVVYDLGSGDGRIPIIAAQEFGARGVGVEIDPELVAKSRERAGKAGVSQEVEFREKDLFDANLSGATVVALYLWEHVNVKLRPKLLRELDPGDRIVSHDFKMGKWEPDTTIVAGRDKTGKAIIHLWTVPKEVPSHLLDVSDELPPEERSPEQE